MEYAKIVDYEEISFLKVSGFMFFNFVLFLHLTGRKWTNNNHQTSKTFV